MDKKRLKKRFLHEDPPSLDALCDEPDQRFIELEKHIRQIKPHVRKRQDLVLAMRARVRKKEEDIFSLLGVEHDYMDASALRLRYPVFDLRCVPSGRVVIYSDDENTLLRIDEEIRQQLEEDTAKLDVYVADAIRWRRCLESFQEDLGVRYAIVKVVGEENPSVPTALVYTVGKDPGVAISIVDMLSGAANAAQVEEDMTREEFFSEKVQRLIKEVCRSHMPNTYIIAHPSDALDQYQLGLMSGRILQGRWFKLHPELIN